MNVLRGTRRWFFWKIGHPIQRAYSNRFKGTNYKSFKRGKGFGLLYEIKNEIRHDRDKKAAQDVIDRLEKKYADRGLKFTIPFEGGFPVQAWGHLDGLRFYFRFRHNYGSLELGEVDVDLDTKYADRLYKQNQALEAKRDAEDKLFFHRSWEHGMQRESDANYYPHIITRRSSLEGPDSEDIHKGLLTYEEKFEFFSTLADSLVDVPLTHPRNARTLDWVETGNTAL